MLELKRVKQVGIVLSKSFLVDPSIALVALEKQNAE